MSLANLLRSSFPAKVIDRGEDYFRAGRAQLDRVSPGHADARVRGAGGVIYLLELSAIREAGRTGFGFHCDCPYAETRLACKHAWAAIRELDRQGLTPTFLEETGLEAAGRDVTAEEPAPRSTSVPASRPARRAKSAREPRPLSWKTLLSSLESRETYLEDMLRRRQGGGAPKPAREVWYALSPAESSVAGLLVVRFYQREIGTSGLPGKLKRLQVGARSGEEMIHPDDREIHDLLFSVRAGVSGHWRTAYPGGLGGAVDQVHVEPTAYLRVVPLLCATGRFFLEDDSPGATWKPLGTIARESGALQWDAGEPWELGLALLPHDTEAFRLELVLRRGEETMPPGEARLFPSLELLLRGTMLARMRGEVHHELPGLLDSRGPCLVPRDQLGAFVESTWKMRDPLRVNLPEDAGWREESAAPRPHLRLLPGPPGIVGVLCTRLAFDYAGRIVDTIEEPRGYVDADARRVVRRDLEAERTFDRRLDQLRLLPDRTRDATPGDRVLPFVRLAEVVGVLAAEGWTVETEQGPVRSQGSWKGSVTSGIDWFDLDGNLNFDGATCTLPALLAAVTDRSHWVRLNDGTLGIIPRGWTERLAQLAGLGDEHDGKLRFRLPQGALLDALLAAEIAETTRDAGFARLSAQLREFDGVRPGTAPPTFRGDLREYQRLGLGWLLFLRQFGFGGCLADDMGLGKTVQVLALLAGLPRNGAKGGRPSLVVAPRSLVYNWIDEAARFAPRLRACDHTGLGRVCSEESFQDCDLVVTTYGTLRRDIVELREIRFDTVILDEAQAIKNPASQAAKACRLLRSDHRLALTGTPVENHLGELWSIFEFLNPGMLGSAAAFRRLTAGIGASSEESVGSAGGAPSGPRPPNEGLEVIARAIRPFLLRRTKETVLTELPEKTEQTQYCQLSTRERRRYEELRGHYRESLRQQVEAEGWNRSQVFVLEALLRLRQAACHPGLIDPAFAGEPSAKLEALFEEIREVLAGGHKALVFSQFTRFLALVRARLDAEGLVYEYLDGQTRDRAAHVRRFQEDPACPLFLISLRAGGQGLNLTAADYVFILDPWWNPAVEAQAIDRAHRIGQARRVFAYRLVARDTIEEKILELQKSKRALSEAILSENEGMLRSLTAEDMEMLLG
jgi:superfamily II DNA or RNA helicase